MTRLHLDARALEAAAEVSFGMVGTAQTDNPGGLGKQAQDLMDTLYRVEKSW